MMGGVAVAGTLRLATHHHSFQDGPLQEIVKLLEFLACLAEALGGVAKAGRVLCVRA